MKKEEIHLWDVQRILIGNAPGEFMLEVFLRTVFIFLFLLVIVRLLGKRMGAQLSLTEMSVMITLGAIVSSPMQDPQRGLLAGVVILLCALGALRGLNLLMYKYQKVEILVQGDVRLLVKGGLIQLRELRQEGFEREELFAKLRSKNIKHLGQISRVYLEACGILSIYKTNQPQSGLSVYPLEDNALMDVQPKADPWLACGSCGWTTRKAPQTNPTSCPNCQADQWTQTVQDEKHAAGNGSGDTDPALRDTSARFRSDNRPKKL